MMIAFVLLLVAASASSTEVEAQPVPAPAQSMSETRLTALLTVNESEGCSGSGDDALVVEFKGDQAVFSQRIWLSSRESAIGGPAHVTRQGQLIRAEVETVVAPIEEGEAVPACLRPVELVLDVSGLPKGDYDLQFVRKTAP